MNWFLSLFRRYPTLGGVPRSPKFAALAREVIKERGGKCEATGYAKDLEVHHVVPYHIDPSRELDKTNLIVLTHWMHFFLAHFGNWSSWNDNIVEDARKLKERIKNRH